MSTTVFKGAIRAGSLAATFLSDSSNADSGLLVMSYAETGGGSPQVEQAVSAPGGSASVGVNAPRKGVLEVWVAAGPATDGGRLQVTRDGAMVDDETIQGPSRWVFAVEPG
jgi:hypothetical protein